MYMYIYIAKVDLDWTKKKKRKNILMDVQKKISKVCHRISLRKLSMDWTAIRWSLDPRNHEEVVFDLAHLMAEDIQVLRALTME